MAVSELAMCVVTIDPMAYVPLLFFAATLSFIGEITDGVVVVTRLSGSCVCARPLGTRMMISRPSCVCFQSVLCYWSSEKY